MTDLDHISLADAIADALGDGWCMGDETEKAAAVGALVVVFEEWKTLTQPAPAAEEDAARNEEIEFGYPGDDND